MTSHLQDMIFCKTWNTSQDNINKIISRAIITAHFKKSSPPPCHSHYVCPSHPRGEHLHSNHHLCSFSLLSPSASLLVNIKHWSLPHFISFHLDCSLLQRRIWLVTIAVLFLFPHGHSLRRWSSIICLAVVFGERNCCSSGKHSKRAILFAHIIRCRRWPFSFE